MTQEEKDLLFADLSSRVHYGVVCESLIPNSGMKGKITQITNKKISLGGFWHDVSQIKPYLRPLKSMTDEEEREFYKTVQPMADFLFDLQEDFRPIQMFKNIPDEMYRFFNSHFFDYHGLIPMGLAQEAPEGMYKP